MRRIPWTTFNVGTGELPNCFVLVPESDTERAELRRAFEDAGVSDSLAFHKSGINGCLVLPKEFTWDPGGAVRVAIARQGQTSPIEAWFWLVECDDGSGRRFAWWNTHDDRDSAWTWS
jgi:hypothetical protein